MRATAILLLLAVLFVSTSAASSSVASSHNVIKMFPRADNNTKCATEGTCLQLYGVCQDSLSKGDTTGTANCLCKNFDLYNSCATACPVILSGNSVETVKAACDQQGTKLSTGAIIGIAAGGVALVALIIGVIVAV
ncbi:hypothetical protein HDU93_004130, partial [Gonapodya sp. JEL0774]